MLAIASYVLISVISVTSALVAMDVDRTLTSHLEGVTTECCVSDADPEHEYFEDECGHDDGTYEEGTYI